MTLRTLVPVAAVPLYTSLPASPVDGQVIDYLADATNGVVWRLRYRAASSSSYKWEFIGGPPLHKEYLAYESFASYQPNTWGGISANDPSVTVPLAGDYDTVATGVMSVNSVAATIYMGLKVGTVEPKDSLGEAAFYYSEAAHLTGGCQLVLQRRFLAV